MMPDSEVPPDKGTTIDLVLNVRKPIGWTSFDVVRLVKQQLPKTKIGHAGTLDPFAEGVLLVCLGKATKKVPQLMALEKEYDAKIQFGFATDSLDVTGRITDRCQVGSLTKEHLREVCKQFLGDIEQVPPFFSAVKVQGQRLYDLARQGQAVEVKARRVRIHAMEVVTVGRDEIDIRVICSKGTYIRSLARDFGLALGTCGYVRSLKRTRIGSYNVSDATEINEIRNYLSHYFPDKNS